MNEQTARAIEAAKEYAAGVTSGEVTRADQVERTIDDLVGRWRDHRTFVWPVAVARVAGVPVVRRRVNR